MTHKLARGLGLALTLGLVAPTGAAMAADSAPTAETTPAASVTFETGTATPAAATRWDGATIGKTAYFLGYRTADNGTDGSIWTYNIKKKTWADTGVDMPVPISNYTIAVLEDKNGTGLYTFGGRDALGETSTVVQVYYPATGTASVVESDPWPGETSTGCVSLAGTGVTVAGNTAYVLGGSAFSTSVPPCADDNSDEVWSFNPKAKNGKKWKAQPSLKSARGYIAPAVAGGKVYAIGGALNEAGTLVAQTTVEAWKPGSKKWNDTKFADLPIGCDETQAFGFDSGPLGGTITVAGCGQWPAAVPDVLQYDVADDSWSTVGTLNEVRRNHAGTNIGTDAKPKLFVAGGYAVDGGTAISSSEIGTPGAAAFGGTLSPAPAPTPGPHAAL